MSFSWEETHEARNRDMSPEQQAEMATDRSWIVRKELARWGATDPGVQVKLAQDPEDVVRLALAYNRHLCPEAATILVESKERYTIGALVCNPAVTREVMLAAFPDAPVIPDLDKKILQRIKDVEGCLDMEEWHTCETTHCRAGWAVVLAGDVGRKLEEEYDTEVAGAVIYVASTERLPDFYADDEEALEDMRRAAGVIS